MTTLSLRDYFTWLLTITVTFAILLLIGSGQEPPPISPQTVQLISLYQLTFVAGMAVSAIFIGSLLWLAVKFWDRSQGLEIE